MARQDYKQAETLFRAVVQKFPSAYEARLGLIRALLGQDRVEEARTEAAPLAQEQNDANISDDALAEIEYRAANLDAAKGHILKAMAADPCDARALAIGAKLVSLSANFGTAARYLATAHKLRPNDEIIRRQWIDSLPAQQRTVELDKYLSGLPSISESTQKELTAESEILHAHHTGECKITTATDRVKLPFQVVFGRSADEFEAYGLDVAINGQHRNLEIDTGASGIVLTPAAAKRLNLKPEHSFKTGGVGDDGDVSSFLTHVANIQIGGVQISDCTIEVLNKADMHSDGLIGLDVFDSWLTTLDYARQQLRLDPLPARPATSTAAPNASVVEDAPQDRYIAPEMKDWSRILRIGHQLLIPAKLKDGPTRYMVVDSGSSFTSVSPLFAKDVGPLNAEYNVHVQGLSGYVKNVYRVTQSPLRFGNFILPIRDLIAFDITSISHTSEFEISGLLGLRDLSRLSVSIDYRDNLMKLIYTYD